jgi:hypothetical protein
MGVYINETDVKNWLSEAEVRRITDDNNDGEPDAGPLGELINAAEAMLEGAARDVYNLAALRASNSFEVRRLIHDCLVAQAAMRFPRAMGRAWEPLMQHARAQLKDLREGRMSLDVEGAPEPAATKGGDYVEGGLGLEDEQPYSYTSDGFGSF